MRRNLTPRKIKVRGFFLGGDQNLKMRAPMPSRQVEGRPQIKKERQDIKEGH